MSADRVLLFCPVYLPRVGGAERQAALSSVALAHSGCRVEVLTIRYEDTWPLIEHPHERVTVRRIPFHDLSRSRLHLRGIGVVNSAWIGARITRAVREASGSFDVLHAYNLSGPMSAFAVRAAKRCGLGTVAGAVSTGDWFDLRLLAREWVWGRRGCRWLLRDVDLWQAVSGGVVEDLLAAGIPRGKILALPNGVEVPQAPATVQEKATRFLYLGRLARTAPRDVEGLIAAFADFSADSASVELAIVGGGENLERVATLAARSPAANRIRVIGHAPREPWLSWADVFVLPSFVEGMSNALLEGMAHGLACIAYDIPPNREALDGGSAGVLIPVGDRARFGEAMKRLATEVGLARDLGERARRRAESVYDIRTVTARLREAYARIR